MENKPWYQKLWEFLDGKKTAIGAVLLIVAAHISNPDIASILSDIGQVLAGAGLIHKSVKTISGSSNENR